MKRTIRLSIFIAALFVPHGLSAADCSECKTRLISVFDFAISLTAPTDNTDTALVNAYFTALKYAPSLAEYLSTSDPSSSCLDVSGCAASATLTKEQVTSNVPVMGWMATTLPHGPSSFGRDYNIQGSVTGTADVLTVTYQITARNSETVATITSQLASDFPTGDLSAQVAVDMQGSVGALYDKLRAYENKKREEGDPYAINPEITLTPEKTNLYINDSTTIKLELKDCDDVVLKNRKITVEECSKGKLDQTTYTTDGDGNATLKFRTTDFYSGQCHIEVSIEFLEPWSSSDLGKRKVRGQTNLNISPPADSWLLDGRMFFDERTTSKTRIGDLGGNSGSTSKNGETYVHLWLKRQVLPSTPVGDLKSYFNAEPEAIIKYYNGRVNESGNSEGLVSSKGGYVMDEGSFMTWSTAKAGAAQKHAVTINPKKYSFSFTGLDAKRTGKYDDSRTIYITGQAAPTIEKSSTDADTSEGLNFSVQDVAHDTSYTTVSSDGTTTTTTSVTQEFTWVDTSWFFLKYKMHFDQRSTSTAWDVTEQTTKTRNVLIDIGMMYRKDGLKPDAILRDPKIDRRQTDVASGINGKVNKVITLYDICGKKVMHFTDNGTTKNNLSPGIYIYRDVNPGSPQVKRLVISKRP